MNGCWHCGGSLTQLSEVGSSVGALGWSCRAGRLCVSVISDPQQWRDGLSWEQGRAWHGVGQDAACVAPGMLPWDRAFFSTAVSVGAQENARGKKGRLLVKVQSCSSCWGACTQCRTCSLMLSWVSGDGPLWADILYLGTSSPLLPYSALKNPISL